MAGYDEDEFQALIAALSFIAAADARIDMREVEFIRMCIQRVFDFDVKPEIVHNYALTSLKNGDAFLADLAEFGADLGESKKRDIFYACALLAHADRSVDDSERKALGRIAAALTIGEDAARRLNAEAAQEAADLFDLA